VVATPNIHRQMSDPIVQPNCNQCPDNRTAGHELALALAGRITATRVRNLRAE
jgi:hypothetical protein